MLSPFQRNKRPSEKASLFQACNPDPGVPDLECARTAAQADSIFARCVASRERQLSGSPIRTATDGSWPTVARHRSIPAVDPFRTLANVSNRADRRGLQIRRQCDFVAALEILTLIQLVVVDAEAGFDLDATQLDHSKSKRK